MNRSDSRYLNSFAKPASANIDVKAGVRLSPLFRFAAGGSDGSLGEVVAGEAAGRASLDHEIDRVAEQPPWILVLRPSLGAWFADDGDPRRSRVRYFSAIAGVPFCGHATIALAVALSVRDGAGSFTFDTPVGPVVIETAGEGADVTASFTAVEPQVAEFDDAVLADLLDLLGVGLGDLDPAYPPRISYSGNWHPVLVFADRILFDSFGFDPDAMRRLMDGQGWAATVAVLHRIPDGEFEARNLFPVGAITEDPATGAAAAAVGAYLRILGLVEPPSRVLIHQGRHVGRPGLLTVDIPAAGGAVVSGTAVQIPSTESAVTGGTRLSGPHWRRAVAALATRTPGPPTRKSCWAPSSPMWLLG